MISKKIILEILDARRDVKNDIYFHKTADISSFADEADRVYSILIKKGKDGRNSRKKEKHSAISQ